MNLTMIVGTFPHWRHLPSLARDAEDVFLFFDHRTSLADRSAAAREVFDRFDIEQVVPFVAAPCPTDCAAGVHDWAQVRAGGCCVALRCRACWQQAQAPEPIPAAETILATV